MEEAINMPTPELGKLEEVNSRDVWTDDQQFTFWLADNLDLLGDALGLNLTLIARKVSVVGHYSLEILAEEAEGGKVAIEDRTGWTDYSHLGQSLKYAAECDAKYVVWVARHFDAEHRAAIDWLNQLASDKVWFYGVEIRAVKIGNSLPAPDFRVVAAPEEWWRTIPDAVALSTQYQAFFHPLIDDLQQEGIIEDSELEGPDCERYFYSGFENVAYRAGFQDDCAEVSCHFYGPAASTRVSALQEPGQEIEGSLTEKWDWIDWDGDESSETKSIEAIMDGFIYDPMERLDEIRAWMLKTLSELKRVLTPRLEKIQAEWKVRSPG